MNDDIQIGGRLRHARLLRGLTLAALGELAGVTESYLSKIENNRARPSFGSLHRIVRALGTNMNALFAASAEGDASDVFIVRRDGRAALPLAHRRARAGVTLENLVPNGPDRLLQVNIHVIGPGIGSEEPIRHTGQEFGLVLEGEFELTVEGSVHHLAEGDAFSFDSGRAHAYRNTSERVSRVLWVNTPPTF